MLKKHISGYFPLRRARFPLSPACHKCQSSYHNCPAATGGRLRSLLLWQQMHYVVQKNVSVQGEREIKVAPRQTDTGPETARNGFRMKAQSWSRAHPTTAALGRALVHAKNTDVLALAIQAHLKETKSTVT